MRPFALSHAILACCPTLLAAASQAPLPQQPPDAERTRVAEVFGRLPLYFIANQGQVDDERVAFYVKGADKTLFFTPGGITFALRGDVLYGESEETAPSHRWALKLDFLGANPETRPVGEDRQQAVFSYFRGRPEDWKTAIPTYGRVVYRDLWPGIYLVYSGTVNQLKYEFVVRPGADPSQIRLAYRGVSELRVMEAGALEVSTPAGGFEDGVPQAWQEIEGERREVFMRYALGAAREDGAHPYGFELGGYDPTQPLVLDPAILVYCGYLGGSDNDDSPGIAVDGQGNAYVTGETGSDESSFPVTMGPDLTINGYGDAFVARVNAQGTALDYCGYIGGTYGERGRGIAVDGQGNAYIAGGAWSGEGSFPITVGPDPTYNGKGAAFVAKVAFTIDFALVSTPDPIVSGQNAIFSVAGATPISNTWLTYSLTGTGVTPIPQLGVTLALADPIQAAGPTRTDASGAVSWALFIPRAAQGLIVYIQAVQAGKTSNVLAPIVQ